MAPLELSCGLHVAQPPALAQCPICHPWDRVLQTLATQHGGQTRTPNHDTLWVKRKKALLEACVAGTGSHTGTVDWAEVFEAQRHKSTCTWQPSEKIRAHIY